VEKDNINMAQRQILCFKTRQNHGDNSTPIETIEEAHMKEIKVK